MDYQSALISIINYYVNLLIIQYHDKPKAKATIALFINLIWANMIIFQIRDGFDLRNAKGVQLDIIGAWVGINRYYNGQLFDYEAWFSLIDWDSTPDLLQGGFSTFDNFDTLSGGFLDYQQMGDSQNSLIDDDFRLLIGLKIIKNSINHTCKNIDNAIHDYFNGEVYTTWSNDTLVYHYPAHLYGVMQVAAYKNVLLVPSDIRLELQEI